MQEPMFLKPVFQEKIWGGSRLRSVFGFDIPNDKIGEDWRSVRILMVSV